MEYAGSGNLDFTRTNSVDTPDWLATAIRSIPAQPVADMGLFHDPSGMRGWWFTYVDEDEDGEEVAYRGKIIGFVPSGNSSGFVVAQQNEDGIWQPYQMVSVKQLWLQRWRLYPPNVDGSCPLPRK